MPNCMTATVIYDKNALLATRHRDDKAGGLFLNSFE